MNNKLLLQDLTDQLSVAGKIKKKDAEEFLRTLFKATEDSLFEGEIIKIKGLGTFKLLLVEARKSVNVSTGEEFEIKEHYKIAYTPDIELKNTVNEPFAHLEPVELEVGPGKKPETTEATHIIDSSNKKSEQHPTKEEIAKAVKKEHSPITEKPEPFPNKKKPFLGWAVFIVIVAALGIWAWMSNQADRKDYAEKIKEIESLDSIEANANHEDSLYKIKNDTTEKIAEATPVETIAPATKTKSKPALPAAKSVDTGISWPITVKITPGNRLTLLALQYYGHKAFWVYLYEANKKILQDPENIPIGTIIHIPKPDPALINANDLNCVAKAKAIQFKLLGH
jgi:nucleoid DNA-binding protein/nucleoid-associated protein YgaU